MGWLKAIMSEFSRAMKMTFMSRELSEKRDLLGRQRRTSWTSDRHLRTGYYFAAPVFIALGVPVMFWMKPSVLQIPLLLAIALLANGIWLGYAAWSRQRSGE